MRWWENNFLRWRKGKLYLGERTAVELAAEHGTPLFFYSREQIRRNLSLLRQAFAINEGPQLQVFYALKANSHPEILRLLREEGTGVDAVSPGEVRAAMEAGFPAERIIYTGTSVSEEDLRQIMAFPDITINIDAAEQVNLMKRVRDAYFPGAKFRVAVRWNPGVGRGFNPKVITAGARSADGTPIKFGVEEKKVVEVFHRAARSGFIPVGLHQHLGSGWVRKDWPVVKEAVSRMIDKASELFRLGFKLEFLDFGGGISPRYREFQQPFPLEKYAQFIRDKIARAGLPIKKIILEPGKFLVADAGVLLMKVVYIKKSYGQYFVCVNAGTYNTVPRPAIYPEARHHIINCRMRRGPGRPVTVAGHLCETGDVFARDLVMPLPHEGDILCVLTAGAYCHSMASSFNLRPIAPEIIL